MRLRIPCSISRGRGESEEAAMSLEEIITTEYTLLCDKCGVVDIRSYEGEGRIQYFTRAKELGWRIFDAEGRDICPGCAGKAVAP